MPKIIIYAVMLVTFSISTVLSQPAIPVTEEKPVTRDAVLQKPLVDNGRWITLQLPCNWMPGKAKSVWGRYEMPQGISERDLNLEIKQQSDPFYFSVHVPEAVIDDNFRGLVIRYTVNSKRRCDGTFGFQNSLVR